MTGRSALMIAGSLALLTALLAPACPGSEVAYHRDDRARRELAEYEAYSRVVARTAAMVGNARAQELAREHGLQILNVTWEDAGRYKGSCVGPNISDMTIQVQQLHPRTEQAGLTCMPVIRFPNFSDKTGDIAPEKFYVLIGNEKGRGLRRVSLRELLGDLRSYLSKPDSWKGSRRSLLAERDSHVLVSAQACFLPIPRTGGAEFNPVLFNYQSCAGDPAVLTLLCTREGTSATVIDNQRDGFSAGRTWGQRLFFNKSGQRCSLTGKRMSDFLSGGDADESPRGDDSPAAAGQEGLNMVLLVQVPLKQKRPMRFPSAPMACGAVAKDCAESARRGSDVENAVIGHGRVEGPFTEIADLEIERDPKFPIRVTVQFYKATSNGVVSGKDLAEIAAQIGKVYDSADYVGSLVTEGETGRPTEYDGDKTEPPGWWGAFWHRYEQNTGQSRADAIAMLRRLYGPNWVPATRGELARAVALAERRK